MKYLAICFLSLAAFLNAGACALGRRRKCTDVRAGSGARRLPRTTTAPDGAIAGALAAALVALQLRRRQKSLHMPEAAQLMGSI